MATLPNESTAGHVELRHRGPACAVEAAFLVIQKKNAKSGDWSACSSQKQGEKQSLGESQEVDQI